ncbi:transcription elongation factor 1 homolog [Macadamia integrifolia]|uniref:transcription elongation factor 1 homolog n=1 Tax=Macadamia integrifolia TaxID=60698 RepID=UPI001C4F831C|nr:transcription elongation factor 1 homolog [Macadamia integrifolia]
MGKRKSRPKTEPKKRMEKLESVFNCPFCNHEKSVNCNIDRKEMIGEVMCIICQERYSTAITNLSEPIDIYSEWIDECERVNEMDGEISPKSPPLTHHDSW